MSAEILGFPGCKQEPTPVVSRTRRGAGEPPATIAGLFAEWRQLRNEAGARDRYAGRICDPAEWEDQTEALSDAMCEIEREIAATPGRTLSDIATKLWLHAHGLDRDYETDVTDDEAYDPKGGLDECQVLSALRDAERLAGSVWSGAAR